MYGNIEGTVLGLCWHNPGTVAEHVETERAQCQDNAATVWGQSWDSVENVQFL